MPNPVTTSRRTNGWWMSSDFGVFLGLDVGKEAHHAVGLDPDGKRLHDGPLPNTEPKLRALFDKLGQHGPLLVVVDQPAAIGALPVAVARAAGHQVALSARADRATPSTVPPRSTSPPKPGALPWSRSPLRVGEQDKNARPVRVRRSSMALVHGNTCPVSCPVSCPIGRRAVWPSWQP
jgi:hypothetical protein